MTNDDMKEPLLGTSFKAKTGDFIGDDKVGFPFRKGVFSRTSPIFTVVIFAIKAN
jgi:hypothetical protein